MSTKIEITDVINIIQSKPIEPSLVRQIVEEMNRAMEPDEDEEVTPHLAKQFSIIISDPDGKLPDGLELVGWVLQIPEEASVTSTTERIHKAAYEFNTTKKGRVMPVKTMADAIENIPAKHFKEQNVWTKTRIPVLILRTNNEIPKENNG